MKPMSQVPMASQYIPNISRQDIANANIAYGQPNIEQMWLDKRTPTPIVNGKPTLGKYIDVVWVSVSLSFHLHRHSLVHSTSAFAAEEKRHVAKSFVNPNSIYFCFLLRMVNTSLARELDFPWAATPAYNIFSNFQQNAHFINIHILVIPLR